MLSRKSVARAALPALALALVPLGGPTAAHAEDPVDPVGPVGPVDPVAALTITRITTENVIGGLSPYLRLGSSIAVTFTDDTPSGPYDYRVDVVGDGFEAEYFPFVWDGATPGSLGLEFGANDLPLDEQVQVTVTELADGEPVATSAAAPFTFSYVGHPSGIVASSKKVKGRWTYKAGQTARLKMTGRWEPGTRIATQVWVSKRKRFTEADWKRNLNGKAALVRGVERTKPVLSFKVPKRLRGQYVWVSVRGWKAGKGGWLHTFSPTFVRR